MIKKIIKKAGCVLLTSAILVTGWRLPYSIDNGFMLANVAKAATVTDKLPIKCFILGSENCTTYKTQSLEEEAGYIFPDDKCTIMEINEDGTVKVEYPLSKGTKEAYARASDFFADTEWQDTVTVLGINAKAYAKPEGNKLTGEVYADDPVCIIAYKNERTQILYPIQDGYKLGWIDGKYSTGGTSAETEPEDSNSGNDTGSISGNTFNAAQTFNAASSKSKKDTKLGSPVPKGCKFSKKTKDCKWYGYHDINRNVSKKTKVYAVYGGKVVFKQLYRTYNKKKYLTSYGNYAELTFKINKDSYKVKYAHLDKFNGIKQKISSTSTKKASGSTGSYTLKTKTVKKGDTLGYIGMTGNASGVHLHFEVWKNGKRIDPVSVISGLV